MKFIIIARHAQRTPVFQKPEEKDKYKAILFDYLPQIPDGCQHTNFGALTEFGVNQCDQLGQKIIKKFPQLKTILTTDMSFRSTPYSRTFYSACATQRGMFGSFIIPVQTQLECGISIFQPNYKQLKHILKQSADAEAKRQINIQNIELYLGVNKWTIEMLYDAISTMRDLNQSVDEDIYQLTMDAMNLYLQKVKTTKQFDDLLGIYAKELVLYFQNEKQLNFLSAHDSTLWALVYMLLGWDVPYPALCDYLVFQIENDIVKISGKYNEKEGDLAQISLNEAISNLKKHYK